MARNLGRQLGRRVATLRQSSTGWMTARTGRWLIRVERSYSATIVYVNVKKVDLGAATSSWSAVLSNRIDQWFLTFFLPQPTITPDEGTMTYKHFLIK